jgi:RES domain-containing protein
VDLFERTVRFAGRAKRLSGIFYRSAVPKYAKSRDLVTGEGSRRLGGRWNPPGLAAVYGSLTPQTAIEEALAHSRYFAIPPHAAMPRTFVAIEFHLLSIFDLTDGALRRSLGVSERRLLNCDWRTEMRTQAPPVTQQLGRAVYLAGLEGILVRSAADFSGRNLAVFVDNLKQASYLKIVAADRLLDA